MSLKILEFNHESLLRGRFNPPAAPIIGHETPLTHACNQVFSPNGNPKPIAASIVMTVDRDNGMLAMKRGTATEYYAGHWNMPGGKLDPGETPLIAAVREYKEETGFEIDEQDLLPLCSQSALREDGTKVLLYIFMLQVEEPFFPNLGDRKEHTAYEWQKPQTFLNGDYELIPSMELMLKQPAILGYFNRVDDHAEPDAPLPGGHGLS